MKVTKRKISDFCKTIEKGTFSAQNTTPGNYPLVVTSEERKTAESFQFNARVVCIPLVSSTGHGHASIKRIHYQEGKFALASILVGLIPDEQICNAKYLYYLLSEKKNKYLIPLMRGSANVSLNPDKIANTEIKLHNISEQKNLVLVLDLIQKMRSTIKERMNFFNNLLQSTFISKFGDLQINSKNWEVDELGNCLVEIEKWNPKKQPRSQIKYVEINSINTETKTIESHKIISKFPSRARNIMKTNDVIFATTRPYYRNVAIVPDYLDGEICSTGFCVLRIRSNGKIRPIFLHNLMQTDFVMYQITKTMHGAHYPAVSNNDILKIVIPIPPLTLQKEFENIAEVVYKIKNQIRASDDKMSALFDNLTKLCFLNN